MTVKKRDGAKNDTAVGDEIIRDDPEARISYVLWQTQHASARLLTEALQPLDMTLSQFGMLKHLHCSTGLTGAELARRLDVTPQSVSTAVAQAKAFGWLRSESHAVHRGLLELALTPAGESVLRAAVRRVIAVEERITSDLSTGERGQLSALLKRVRKRARGF